MYCPRCRTEYIEGITDCPDCGKVLVEQLPEIVRHPAKQHLKLATLLIIIGMSYNFVLRTVGTAAPGLFKYFPVPFITNVLLFIVGIVGVYFFVVFYREYAINRNAILKNATAWAIAGTVAMLIVYFRNTAIEYNFYPPLTVQLKSMQIIDAVIPWLASITLLIFAISFFKECRGNDLIKLKKPAIFYVLGSIAGTVWLTFVMLNYLVSNQLFQYNKFMILALISFPVVAFGFGAVLYFYISFYRTLYRA